MKRSSKSVSEDILKYLFLKNHFSDVYYRLRVLQDRKDRTNSRDIILENEIIALTQKSDAMKAKINELGETILKEVLL